MTSEQKAAFILSQVAMLNAEIAMMQAANSQRQHHGLSMEYSADAFHQVITNYEAILGHNAVIGFFRS